MLSRTLSSPERSSAARRRPCQAQQQLDSRGLARAVRSQERDDGVLGDFQVEGLECRHAFVELAQALGSDCHSNGHL